MLYYIIALNHSYRLKGRIHDPPPNPSPPRGQNSHNMQGSNLEKEHGVGVLPYRGVRSAMGAIIIQAKCSPYGDGGLAGGTSGESRPLVAGAAER